MALIIATDTERRVIEILTQLDDANQNKVEGFMSCLLMQQSIEELQKKQTATAQA